MADAFAALEAEMSRAVDAHLGQSIRFTPQGRTDSFGNPVGAADGRTIVECVGNFLDGDTDTLFASGDRPNNSFNSRAAMQTAFVSVDKSNFPDGAPRRNDIVTLLDAVPIREFHVIDAYHSGARWAIALSAASVET
jgi:hypothetical protein